MTGKNRSAYTFLNEKNLLKIGSFLATPRGGLFSIKIIRTATAPSGENTWVDLSGGEEMRQGMKKIIGILSVVLFLGACGGSPKHAVTSKDGKKTNHAKRGSQSYIPAYGEDVSLEDVIYESLGHRHGSGVKYSNYVISDGKFDIPVTYNPYVQKWIDYFTGSGRNHFERYLTRSGRFIPYMHAVLKKYGLPKDIVYLSMIESGFNIRAKSWASAVGPWQFIRSTGAFYGLNADYYLDERRDVEKATDAAARHLKDLYDEFGDWYLAFAAYNAGAGKVKGAINRSGTNFWDMVEGNYLRQETKDYVPKILAAAIVAKNPAKYGFTHIEYQLPIDYEKVRLSSPVDLEVAADCSGVEPDLIRLLNPELLQDMTPPHIPNYMLNIPAGTKTRFSRKYASLSPSQRLQAKEYIVKRGDSVREIASMYGVSERDLAQANPGGIDVDRDTTTRKVAVRGRHGRVKYKNEKVTVASYSVNPGSSLTIPKNRSLAGYSSSRDDDAAHAARREFGINVAELDGPPKKLSKKEKKALEKQQKEEQQAQAKTEKEAQKVAKKQGKGQLQTLPTAARVDSGTPVATAKTYDDLAIEGDPSPRGGEAANAPVTSPQEAKSSDLPPLAKKENATSEKSFGGPMAINDRPEGVVSNEGPTAPSEAELREAVQKIQPSAQDLPSSETEAPKQRWVEQDTQAPAREATPPAKARPAKPTYYVVKKGDTLTAIADRYGVSVQDLKQWNGKKVLPYPKSGLKIQVGGKTAAPAPQVTAKNEKVSAAKTPSSKSNTKIAGKNAASASKNKVVRYKVKPGDNLVTIAKRHDTTPQQIQKLNGLKGPKLVPGAILVVNNGK